MYVPPDLQDRRTGKQVVIQVSQCYNSVSCLERFFGKPLTFHPAERVTGS